LGQPSLCSRLSKITFDVAGLAYCLLEAEECGDHMLYDDLLWSIHEQVTMGYHLE